ncbi:AAA family ATPase [Desulfofundulus thermobenzoicus]|uniref:AAA family ATPase n=1 Tax=Desulfofundulus thermobenzoicus TaxID=29376 RepID=UPI00188384D7
MYLEEVKIHGFKSYATEIVINFKPGIGVIIGSNGVGKSNILDAIAWALGESDLHRLRCHSDTDLFFSGTREYPPAETAAVTLALKLGLEKKAPGMQMTRQRDRLGRERFLLDEEEIAQVDYQQRIKETGLLNAKKTLIRQEEINNFLALDPEDRLKYLADLFHPRPVNDDLVAKLNNGFKQMLKMLIPDSDGHLLLAATGRGPGLIVEMAFPGKGMRNSILLSGGEKTICSLALHLAFFEELPSPFYMFDEVEPSLDWTNHHHMQKLFKRLAENRQLIMITHLRSTIELADTLHGIRARNDGTSFAKFYFRMDERILRAYKCC